jgi:hypothetical protein
MQHFGGVHPLRLRTTSGEPVTWRAPNEILLQYECDAMCLLASMILLRGDEIGSKDKESITVNFVLANHVLCPAWDMEPLSKVAITTKLSCII